MPKFESIPIPEASTEEEKVKINEKLLPPLDYPEGPYHSAPQHMGAPFAEENKEPSEISVESIENVEDRHENPVGYPEGPYHSPQKAFKEGDRDLWKAPGEDGMYQKENTEETAGEEVNETERKMSKIDDVFDDLLDRVKDSPELEKEALKIAIDQFRQIGEQMKQVRDMEHFQELKKLMLKQWDELNELTKGDPKLLKSIQEWGKSFIDEKVIYYDMINEVKNELVDKSQEIQESWNDMQIDIGKAAGMAGIKGELAIHEYLEKTHIDFTSETLENEAGIAKFIESLNNITQGYSDEDLDIQKANKFLERLNGLNRRFAALAYEENGNSAMQPVVENIREGSKKLSSAIKDASKIYKVVKKIRDTHFLKLYNEQPEQVAA